MEVINKKRVLIERKDGVSIYGKIINNRGKLGLFEVEFDYQRTNGETYAMYYQAEAKMNFLIGVKNNQS